MPLPSAPVVGNAPETSGPSLSDKDVPKETAGKLADIFASASDDYVEQTPEKEKPVTEEKKPVTVNEPKIEPVAEKPADESAVVEETTTPDSAEETPAGPVLPAAYRRTLKAYEYTDDEIEAALKSGGESFISAASKMHQTRNKEIAAWAELGRRNKATQQASTPAQPAEAPTALKPLDIEALQSKYGKDEPLIQQLIPVNQAIAEMNRILPTVRQYEQAAAKSAQDTVAKQVDGFFASDELKEFKDQYGDTDDLSKLTNEQAHARMKVMDLASALITGSQVQGRTITLNDALQLAHDSSIVGTRTTVVRQQIAGELQKRQAGMTLKPASRVATPKPVDNKKGSPELRTKVKTGLKAIFS